MDCYRLIGDESLAAMHAREIIKKSTAFSGTDVSPMRKAEAELTLGVIAARNGAVDEALTYGHNALSIDRRSQPSLLMVGSELDHALQQRYPNNTDGEPSMTPSPHSPVRPNRPELRGTTCRTRLKVVSTTAHPAQRRKSVHDSIYYWSHDAFADAFAQLPAAHHLPIAEQPAEPLLLRTLNGSLPADAD